MNTAKTLLLDLLAVFPTGRGPPPFSRKTG